MLKLPLIALFLRTIPEGIIVTWISYLILSKNIDKKRICISGILFGMITYGVRMLPIYFGIHMIIILIGFIIILHKINQVDLYKAVSVSIASFVLQIVCEWATIIIYVFLLKIDIEMLSQETVESTMMGMPSLLVMIIIGIVIKQLKKVKATEVN